MSGGMGLALGDAESEDEDLFGNNKETEKKNENVANW